MRWLFVSSVLIFAVPVLAQENEAEKLYRGFEKKLADAAAYKVAFDVEMTMFGKQEIKGELLVAKGNKLRIMAELTGAGKMKKIHQASDGKHIQKQTSQADKTETNKAIDTHDKLTEYVTGFMGRTGVILSLENAVSPRPDRSPDKVKLSGFKLLGKDKIDGTETQGIEFAVEFPGEKASAVGKVWIDAKTQLPLKRSFEQDAGGMVIRIVETYSKWQIDPPLKGDEFNLPK